MSPVGFVFDAYGTLFDVHAAMRKHADVLGDQWNAVSETWRSKQLEYTWVRSLMGSYAEFWRLTEDALDFALARHGLSDDALRSTLLEAYWTLGAYSDAVPALEALRADGHRIAVLSNASPDMLHAAMDSAGLTSLVDDVFSVDAIKVFKTAPEVYQMVLDAWDTQADKAVLVSSNRWDIAGASKFGMQTAWCNRAGMPDEYPGYPPSRVVAALTELA